MATTAKKREEIRQTSLNIYTLTTGTDDIRYYILLLSVCSSSSVNEPHQSRTSSANHLHAPPNVPRVS